MTTPNEKLGLKMKSPIELDPVKAKEVHTDQPEGIPAGLPKCDKCGWNHAPDDSCVPPKELSPVGTDFVSSLQRELIDCRNRVAEFEDKCRNYEGVVVWANETIALFRGKLEAAEKLNWMLPRNLAGA